MKRRNRRVRMPKTMPMTKPTAHDSSGSGGRWGGMQEQQRLRGSRTRAATKPAPEQCCSCPHTTLPSPKATVLTLTDAQLDNRQEDVAHNDVDGLVFFWVCHLGVELRTAATRASIPQQLVSTTLPARQVASAPQAPQDADQDRPRPHSRPPRQSDNTAPLASSAGCCAAAAAASNSRCGRRPQTGSGPRRRSAGTPPPAAPAAASARHL